MTEPDECRSMAEVRAGVDAVDAELVALLARRFAYMRAAARLKGDRTSVRDEARKAEVLDNAIRHAAEAGLPEGLAARLWDQLVEASIEYELAAWDLRHRL